jgi:hypothetical protein
MAIHYAQFGRSRQGKFFPAADKRVGFRTEGNGQRFSPSRALQFSAA